MTLRIGSMCSGYEGLGMAVQSVLGGELAWVADIDPGASAILAHRFPGVPNLGDIAARGWSPAESVDIVTAGFPCQDLSYAGRGAGIVEGSRSGLWYAIADALGVLRPQLVVLENVAAIVGRRPGLDVVLSDLARLGFDAEWVCIRASDVGAPHQRERWFAVAYPASSGPRRRRGGRPAWASARSGESVRACAEPDDRGVDAAAYAERDRLEGREHPARPDEAGAPEDDRRRGPSGGDRSAAAICWGPYEPAVRRWERILGRPVPYPTEPGRTGPRLSPRFVEWVQGLPDGWVSDIPGISRNDKLKALGNGVVPQQAVMALRMLLPGQLAVNRAA